MLFTASTNRTISRYNIHAGNATEKYEHAERCDSSRDFRAAFARSKWKWCRLGFEHHKPSLTPRPQYILSR